MCQLANSSCLSTDPNSPGMFYCYAFFYLFEGLNDMVLCASFTKGFLFVIPTVYCIGISNILWPFFYNVNIWDFCSYYGRLFWLRDLKRHDLLMDIKTLMQKIGALGLAWAFTVPLTKYANEVLLMYLA